ASAGPGPGRSGRWSGRSGRRSRRTSTRPRPASSPGLRGTCGHRPTSDPGSCAGPFACCGRAGACCDVGDGRVVRPPAVLILRRMTASPAPGSPGAPSATATYDAVWVPEAPPPSDDAPPGAPDGPRLVVRTTAVDDLPADAGALVDRLPDSAAL